MAKKKKNQNAECLRKTDEIGVLSLTFFLKKIPRTPCRADLDLKFKICSVF
jgi:hypothetical protein